jgi:asparagine synthase (glutamine-hydrolysing)
MCGICGIASPAPSTEIGPACLALTRGLRHRGPDGEGFLRMSPTASGLCSPEELREPSTLAVGHRRLSIVDIAGGAQPMANENETVWVSYNGEIYNHLELRRELIGRGHRFTTQADTEVLVHGWEEWGEGLFGRLNGIFALALIDVTTGEVVLVRDPVGVKPLYVGRSDKLFWWSSELGPARDAGLVSTPVSADALKLFLTFRFIPSPYTIFEDVWKLPPGHFVRLRATEGSGRPEFVPFEQTVRSSADPRTKKQWREAILAELDEAVGRQLMADVPVASLLSGGVDSSLVTQMMARRLPYRPHTYGIGFMSDGSASEALAAARAAASLDVPHTSIEVDAAAYIDRWPRAVAEIGEPIANSGGLLVWMLSDEVRRTHKVVLTGQGADEPLGGYPRHVVERLRPYASLSPALAVRVVRALKGRDDAARLARALAAPTQIDRYVDILSVVPPEQVDLVVRGASASARELAREAVGRWTSGVDSGDGLNDFLRVDVRMSLADDLLLIADHFSMRSSVELRVPFLDLQFLELVERMPSRYKVSALGSRKWLYRSAAAASLPEAIRRTACGPRARFGRKRGFSTPLAAWFDAEGGLLADPAQWVGSLVELGAVELDSVQDLLVNEPETFARQRAAFYSLATWVGATAGTSR